MKVAIIAGTAPKPNNMMPGIKYTKAGIVCIKSSIGRIFSLTLFALDIQLPIGTTITRHKKILINIIEVVAIALSQNLGCKNPMKNVQKPTATVVLIFLPLAK